MRQEELSSLKGGSVPFHAKPISTTRSRWLYFFIVAIFECSFWKLHGLLEVAWPHPEAENMLGLMLQPCTKRRARVVVEEPESVPTSLDDPENT